MKALIHTSPFTSFTRRSLLIPLVVLCFFLFNIWTAVAVENNDFERANEYYKSKDYQHAIQLYQKILGTGVESASLYFNLGNCYFKSDSIARAILYYEKAKKIAPADEDILFNLKVAGQRKTDKDETSQTFFLGAWWNSFRHSKTADNWAWLCVLCVVVSFMLFATFVAFPASITKRYGFWGGSFFALLAVFMFMVADSQYNESTSSNEAIIMVDAVSVKSSPEEKGKEIYIRHAGTKLQVINTEGQWSEVRLSDKNVGWVPSSSLESI
jgi:tetratricopeptide (TPR) repeat protein